MPLPGKSKDKTKSNMTLCWPKYYDIEIDLSKLYCIVQEKGGYENIMKEKKWRECSVALGMIQKGTVSMSWVLRTTYERFLKEFAESRNNPSQSDFRMIRSTHTESQILKGDDGDNIDTVKAPKVGVSEVYAKLDETGNLIVPSAMNNGVGNVRVEYQNPQACGTSNDKSERTFEAEDVDTHDRNDKNEDLEIDVGVDINSHKNDKRILDKEENADVMLAAAAALQMDATNGDTSDSLLSTPRQESDAFGNHVGTTPCKTEFLESIANQLLHMHDDCANPLPINMDGDDEEPGLKRVGTAVRP